MHVRVIRLLIGIFFVDVYMYKSEEHLNIFTFLTVASIIYNLSMK